MSRFFQPKGRRMRSGWVLELILLRRWREVPILMLLIGRIRSGEYNPGRQWGWWRKVLARRDNRGIASYRRIEAVLQTGCVERR